MPLNQPPLIFFRSIFVVGYAASSSRANVYGGYMSSPSFCSVAIKIAKLGESLLHEYLMLKHVRRCDGVQTLKLWTSIGGRQTLVTSPFGVPLSRYGSGVVV